MGGPAFSAGDTGSPAVAAIDRQASPAAVTNEAEDQYLFATELFGKKMYELAVQQYEKFVNQFPQHPKAFQARLRIGESLFRLNQYDRAVAAYEKALALQPNSSFRADALVGMGLALFNQKNYARATTTLREAEKLTANDKTLGPVAANWLGEALFASENYAEAITAYEAVGKWPDSAQAPQAIYSIGFCQLKLNHPEQAAETFRKVAAQYGESSVAPRALVKLVEAYRRINYKEELRETCAHLRQYYPKAEGLNEACPAETGSP